MVQSIKLGELADFQSGGTPSKNKVEFYNGKIPWITTVALNGGFLRQEDATDWITDEAVENSATKIVPANSLMIGTRVGIGKVAINSIPMATNQDIVSLVGIDEKRWNKEYLCWFVQSKSTYLQSQSRGSTIKGIKQETLAELNVPLLRREMQLQIASVLRETRNIIALRKRQLAEMDTLVKARFMELFGDLEINSKRWPVLEMGKICRVRSSKRIYQNEQSFEGVPFWRISDLTTLINTGTVAAELFIPEERYIELQAQGQVPEAGDILITSRGTLGQCYIVQAGDRFYFQDGMISWLSKFDDRITPLYISYLFKDFGFFKQIEAMQAGSTVSYLSIAMIKRLKVMLPPLAFQNQFADFVRETEKTRAGVRRGLAEAERLFASLMQEYFS